MNLMHIDIYTNIRKRIHDCQGNHTHRYLDNYLSHLQVWTHWHRMEELIDHGIQNQMLEQDEWLQKGCELFFSRLWRLWLPCISSYLFKIYIYVLCMNVCISICRFVFIYLLYNYMCIFIVIAWYMYVNVHVYGREFVK